MISRTVLLPAAMPPPKSKIIGCLPGSSFALFMSSNICCSVMNLHRMRVWASCQRHNWPTPIVATFSSIESFIFRYDAYSTITNPKLIVSVNLKLIKLPMLKYLPWKSKLVINKSFCQRKVLKHVRRWELPSLGAKHIFCDFALSSCSGSMPVPDSSLVWSFSGGILSVFRRCSISIWLRAPPLLVALLPFICTCNNLASLVCGTD